MQTANFLTIPALEPSFCGLGWGSVPERGPALSDSVCLASALKCASEQNESCK